MKFKLAKFLKKRRKALESAMMENFCLDRGNFEMRYMHLFIGTEMLCSSQVEMTFS